MNISQDGLKKLDLAISLLRYSFVFYFLVIGADKFVFLLSDWSQFIASVITNYIPIDTLYLVYGLGAVEIIIGLYILFMCACSGGLLAAAFFVLLIINMLLMKVYAGILIYLLLAVAAYVMSLVVEARKEVS